MAKKAEQEEETVIIVGAGQSGLAVAACLAARNIPSLILERDDCVGSLWRKRAYDRVSLHLAKQYCQLPLAPYPPDAPRYICKWDYVRYPEDYAARFRLRISFRREVTSTEYDEASRRWRLTVRNLDVSAAAEKGEAADVEEYVARYLVVASGENDEVVMPEIPGIDGFVGPVIHSSQYRSGLEYKGRSVLVVGSGNSGMEIAGDLAEFGAHPSITVRNQVHIVSKDIWLLGMILVNFLPCCIVDAIILLLSFLTYGNMAKYGFHRPRKGPMYLKKHGTAYPVMDTGTVEQIKAGKLKVMPTSLESINGNYVKFSDGSYQHFDAIVLATGYRSTVNKWLKGGENLIDEDGMAKNEFPNNWKGRNGLYCAGLARRGIYGSGEDAESIASDIAPNYHPDKKE